MSSFVFASPEAFASAAQNLTGIGAAITSANSAAALPTTQVAAAAQDEVSAAIASLFSAHAQNFQALSAHSALFHEQFAHALTGAGNSYAATANASALQTVKQDLQNLVQHAAATVKAGEEAYANLQTLLEAYENNPSLANLLALQLAIQQLGTVAATDANIIDGVAQVLRQALMNA